jgi:hypothetical protein
VVDGRHAAYKCTQQGKNGGIAPVRPSADSAAHRGRIVDAGITVKRGAAEAAVAPGGAAGPERAWHTLPVEEVARLLQADTARGLNDTEATRRRERFGPNALAEAKGRSPC